MKKNFRKFICLLSLSFVTLSGCSWDQVKETATNTWNTVSDTASDVWDTVSDTAGDVWDNITDTTTTVVEKIKEYAEPVIDNVTTGAKYVYDNVAHFTQETYANVSAKAQNLAGDVQEYFTGINPNDLKQKEVVYSEPKENVIKDQDGGWGNPHGLNHDELYDADFEEFIPYYVSTIIRSAGYEVYFGAAFQKGTTYPGLIFTKNDEAIEYQGKDTFICGFLQLKTDGDGNAIVTEEIVEKGLVAVPDPQYKNEKGIKDAYIITDFTSIETQAGVAFNTYFELEQYNRYVLNVYVKENKPETYQNYEYEVYDFDNDRVLKEKVGQTNRDILVELTKSNPEAVEGGILTVNAIADINEGLSEDEELTNVVTFDESIIQEAEQSDFKDNVDTFVENYSTNQEKMDVNAYSDVKKENEAPTKTREEKITEGAIATVASSLALVGATASVVFGLVNGGIVIKAIVITAGVSAIVYNVGNIIEGVENIYYGAINSEKVGVNPVYNAFKDVIGDEKTATIVYHAWGIASTLITSLTVPATKALMIAKASHFGVFKTCVNVIRAVFVTIVKGGAAAIGGALIGNLTAKIVTHVTDNRCLGTIVGFATTLLVSILIFKGLDNLDKKLNASGLYPKADAISSYKTDSMKKQEEYTYGHNDGDFKNMSNSEKEAWARYIRDTACERLGVEDKPTISFVYDANSNAGGYSNYNNHITINMAEAENTSWRGFADSIAHECRHAWQYEQAYYNPYSDVAVSLDNYIQPLPDHSNYNAYRYQPCEADAFNFGERFASWFLNLIGIFGY